ncbi:MAG: sulfatase [Bacteroidota bacterium]
MNKFFYPLCSFLLLLLGNSHPGITQSHPNILFIAIDDMNDWVGFLHTHPQVQTPHMDAMASEGISFVHAHCPAPICGPSRTAIMSGQWPSTTGIYTNQINYRKELPHLTSLPEHFRNQGYYVMGVGKIFHSSPSKMPEEAFDEYGGKGGSASPFSSADLQLAHQTPFHEVQIAEKSFRLPLNGIPADRYWNKSHTFDWGAVDLPDSLFSDAQNTGWAIEKLKRSYDQPFFLALGFSRPHQPLYNPKRFHDLYPLDSVQLPPRIEHDLADVPRSGKEQALLAGTSGLHSSVEQYGEWEHAVSSYLASISFVDHLVGKLMAALRKSPYADNTWIVLWSDHGWHLGEKFHWGKATPWFRSTRIPLLIIPPTTHFPTGFQAHSATKAMVNLIDLAPSLADMANIPHLPQWEGNSLIPLVANPQQSWSAYTVTTSGRGNHSITTRNWQYIHYFDGSDELYHLAEDPNQFVNLVNDSLYSEAKKRLMSFLPAEPQWKQFIRYHNFKAVIPADGSPMLLFNMAYQNQANEQLNVAKDYPMVVQKIQTWLDRRQPTGKYLNMTP